ncbi:hypothetical protein [Streptomyces heilongjiangensis]|uniref:Transposase n=1 Tax=Streptomyces heilongjiangensis TaxID=945052 RepID=A0ABW1BHH9_9ACTN|nr:hypothetical protein [Streptomyces heilongjiangensis]MDC2952560.1 hypothetical protein [Streptomyces heilongjiangensis]
MRTEEQESGWAREYLTRCQLWAYARRRRTLVSPWPPSPAGSGETVAVLAERHGGGLSTWKRIVTQARRQR